MLPKYGRQLKLKIMNTAQLQAMRSIAEAMHKTNKPSMTAQEMALTPHDLRLFGSVAVTKDGVKYSWDQNAQLWQHTTF